MILITGGTGFIGKVLIRQLTDLGHPIRLLLQPSQKTPDLPKGMPLDVAITSMNDERGLRAAMKSVDAVFHLASAEQLGRKAQLTQVDIEGTKSLVRAASQMRIDRIIYLSKTSGVPFTIIRSAITYGNGDHFTNGLAFLLKFSPYFVMVPDQGSSLLQPIWIKDLVNVMAWTLQMHHTINETIEIGGPEYLSFKEICEMIARAMGIKRQFVSIKPVVLNRFTEILEIMLPNIPSTVFWLDYLAANRTTDLGNLAERFSLLPARMKHKLGYLGGKNYHKQFWQIITKRKRTIIQWE